MPLSHRSCEVRWDPRRAWHRRSRAGSAVHADAVPTGDHLVGSERQGSLECGCVRRDRPRHRPCRSGAPLQVPTTTDCTGDACSQHRRTEQRKPPLVGATAVGFGMGSALGSPISPAAAPSMTTPSMTAPSRSASSIASVGSGDVEPATGGGLGGGSIGANGMPGAMVAASAQLLPKRLEQNRATRERRRRVPDHGRR